MEWEIRYYLTESAYKAGVVAFRESVIGDRNYVVTWAQGRLQHTEFKYYDLIQK